MTDIKRNCLKSLRYLLDSFPCVVVLGARQVGKTTLLDQVLPGADKYDLERQADFQLLSRDPDFFLSLQKKPIVIDEAQLLPELFPALRVAIDARRSEKGRFLLSGLSSPALLNQITESLAGRVAILELAGFQWDEFWERPSSKFYDVFQSETSDFSNLVARYTHEELLQACLVGSYPEPVLRRDDAKFNALWKENYLSTYVKRDVRALFPDIQLQTYETFIRMLTHSSGQILNLSDFARSLDVSQPTAKNYLRIAEGTFLWRSLESYHHNVVKRVSKLPRGHLRDSGLLCHMLNINSKEALLAHPQFGRIWEGFVIEELLQGFSNRLISVKPYYYRTQHQAEIDLILEGSFGLIPIEIKSGFKTEKKQLKALQDFIEEQKCPYGIVINNADKIQALTAKIIQIPASCL